MSKNGVYELTNYKDRRYVMGKASFQESVRDTLVITNSFIHDMATGLWIGAVLVMKLTIGEAVSVDSAQVKEFAVLLLAELWWVSIVSFLVMMLTGAARVFTLKYYGWTGDIAKGRKKLLIIKHILLTIIVTFGLYLQISVYYAM